MVENLAVIRAFARFHAAHTPGTHRISLLDPVCHIEVVNVLFDDVVATNPDKVIPIAHLILHLGQFAAVFLLQFSPRFYPGRRAVPINPHGHDVADRSIVQSLDGLKIIRLVPPLQAHADLQILLLRFLGGGKHPADTGRICGHGFFHEDVLALFDCFLEMDRAKPGRSRENHHVGQPDRLFVGVKPDEFLVVRDRDRLGVLLFQVLQALVELVWEGIRHGDQLHPGSTRDERLIRRPGPAPPAADQRDLQLVAPGRVRAALDAQPAEERAADDGGGSFEEIPTRSLGRGRVVIGWVHGLDRFRLVKANIWTPTPSPPFTGGKEIGMPEGTPPRGPLSNTSAGRYSFSTPLFQYFSISSGEGTWSGRTRRKPRNCASVWYQMLLGSCGSCAFHPFSEARRAALRSSSASWLQAPPRPTCG